MTALELVEDRPDTAALAADASEIVRQAQAITITDEEGYRFAGEVGKGIRSLQKRITDFFASHKKRAKAVHDALCADEKAQLAPTEQAVEILKRKMLDWNTAVARKQEKDRKRREAEALRLEEERQIQRALDAEEAGDWPETVEEILSEPIEAPIVATRPPALKVAGVAATKRWTFDAASVDLAAIIRHIAGLPADAKLAHPENLNLLVLNSTAARQLITAQRENFNVPGIRHYQADGVSFGSK